MSAPLSDRHARLCYSHCARPFSFTDPVSSGISITEAAPGWFGGESEEKHTRESFPAPLTEITTWEKKEKQIRKCVLSINRILAQSTRHNKRSCLLLKCDKRRTTNTRESSEGFLQIKRKYTLSTNVVNDSWKCASFFTPLGFFWFVFKNVNTDITRVAQYITIASTIAYSYHNCLDHYLDLPHLYFTNKK